MIRRKWSRSAQQTGKVPLYVSDDKLCRVDVSIVESSSCQNIKSKCDTCADTRTHGSQCRHAMMAHSAMHTCVYLCYHPMEHSHMPCCISQRHGPAQITCQALSDDTLSKMLWKSRHRCKFTSVTAYPVISSSKTSHFG